MKIGMLPSTLPTLPINDSSSITAIDAGVSQMFKFVVQASYLGLMSREQDALTMKYF